MSMKFRPLTIAAALAAVAVPSAAEADGLNCQSQVNSVAASYTGSVAFDGGYGFMQICSTAGVTNGISADTCKTYLSMLMTAHSTGRLVSLSFDTEWYGNAGLTSCTVGAFGNWAWHSPYLLYLLP